MNLKKSFILAALLLLATLTNAQKVDFGAFAGLWESEDGTRGLDIRYSFIRDLKCGVNIAGQKQYTEDVAQVDSVLYIDFPFPRIDTLCCDTLYHHLLFVARLTIDGTLEVRRRQLEEFHSPIFGFELSVASDTLYYLNKVIKYTPPAIHPSRPMNEREYDNDIFKMYLDAEDFFIVNYHLIFANPDTLSRKQQLDRAECRGDTKFLFNQVFKNAIYQSMSKYDGNDMDLVGTSAYYLMLLEDDIKEKSRYASFAMMYYPDCIDKGQRLDAEKIKNSCDHEMIQGYTDVFRNFVGLCDFVKKYDQSDDSIQGLFRDAYLWTLWQRASFAISYWNDTSVCVADMQRVHGVDTSIVWTSDMHMLMSNEYYNMAIKADSTLEDNKPLVVGSLAESYYRNSLAHFDSARVDENVLSTKNVKLFLPVWVACDRLKDSRPLIERISDTNVVFYLNHPERLYHENAPYAESAILFLLNNNREREALSFYDTIKGNFRFDAAVNNAYFEALRYNGYGGEEVSNAIRLSNSLKFYDPKQYIHIDSTFQDNLLQSAQINLGNGDIQAAYNDLMKIKSDTMNIFLLRLLMMGIKEGNESAYWECNRLIVNNLVPDSLLYAYLYYRGWYAEQWARETQDSARRDSLLADAKADYEKAISIEDSLKVPYVFFQLGQREKALRIVEHNLHCEGGPDASDYLTAANLYCMSGDMRKAKRYAKLSLELEHDFFSRVWIEQFDPYLEPIRDYVSGIVAQYAEEDTSINRLKTLKFDTLKTVIPFVVSETGSMYVSCIINGFPLENVAKIDNGADLVQISKDKLCELVQYDLISVADYLGTTGTKTADGTSHNMKCVMLRSLQLGNIPLHNVVAVVSEKPDAPELLLGQSVLANFIMEVNPFKAQITLTKLDEIRE